MGIHFHNNSFYSLRMDSYSVFYSQFAIQTSKTFRSSLKFIETLSNSCVTSGIPSTSSWIFFDGLHGSIPKSMVQRNEPLGRLISGYRRKMHQLADWDSNARSQIIRSLDSNTGHDFMGLRAILLIWENLWIFLIFNFCFLFALSNGALSFPFKCFLD